MISRVMLRTGKSTNAAHTAGATLNYDESNDTCISKICRENGKMAFSMICLPSKASRRNLAVLSRVHTSNKVDATLSNATSRMILSTKSNVAWTLLPFSAIMSNSFCVLSTKSNKSNMFNIRRQCRTIQQQVAVEDRCGRLCRLSKVADVFGWNVYSWFINQTKPQLRCYWRRNTARNMEVAGVEVCPKNERCTDWEIYWHAPSKTMPLANNIAGIQPDCALCVT